jgi:hypothetical protein
MDKLVAESAERRESLSTKTEAIHSIRPNTLTAATTRPWTLSFPAATRRSGVAGFGAVARTLSESVTAPRQRSGFSTIPMKLAASGGLAELFGIDAKAVRARLMAIPQSPGPRRRVAADPRREEKGNRDGVSARHWLAGKGAPAAARHASSGAVRLSSRRTSESLRRTPPCGTQWSECRPGMEIAPIALDFRESLRGFGA